VGLGLDGVVGGDEVLDTQLATSHGDRETRQTLKLQPRTPLRLTGSSVQRRDQRPHQLGWPRAALLWSARSTASSSWARVPGPGHPSYSGPHRIRPRRREVTRRPSPGWAGAGATRGPLPPALTPPLPSPTRPRAPGHHIHRRIPTSHSHGALPLAG